MAGSIYFVRCCHWQYLRQQMKIICKWRSLHQTVLYINEPSRVGVISFSNGGYQIFGRKHFHCSMAAVGVKTDAVIRIQKETFVSGLSGFWIKESHPLPYWFNQLNWSINWSWSGVLYMHKHIFGPGHMTHSYTHVNYNQKHLIQQLLWMYRYCSGGFGATNGLKEAV